MKRKLLMMLTLLCVTLLSTSATVKAITPPAAASVRSSENAKKNVLDPQPTKTLKQYYDEFYNEKNGFLSVPETVKTFEDMYHKQVVLPTFYPFPILMQKAKLAPSPNRKSTALRVYYLGDRSGDTLILDVFVKYPLQPPSIFDDPILLQDGTKAYFRVRQRICFLDFEKANGLHYILGIWKNEKRPISKEDMLKIANSMSE
ncbi:hypothetical protein CBW65_10265 [Tumebacillus avium]|uniref:DUF4367 domain-containing protein n=1 Tax=Tumebacillus avium TaxID=1903704 RepID=A0A1Y0IM26_9BACL|nr:hypothetical protein [Tumebacillus avium]ARU61340.1 hypothetical protein CBW65_10265 [Tumebacillus avium]